MILPFGFPLTNVAAPLDIFCFLRGSSEGENGEGVRETDREKSVHSDGGGVGLRSEETGTMASEISQAGRRVLMI